MWAGSETAHQIQRWTGRTKCRSREEKLCPTPFAFSDSQVLCEREVSIWIQVYNVDSYLRMNIFINTKDNSYLMCLWDFSLPKDNTETMESSHFSFRHMRKKSSFLKQIKFEWKLGEACLSNIEIINGISLLRFINSKRFKYKLFGYF